MTRTQKVEGIVEDFQVIKHALIRCMSGHPQQSMPSSQWLALSVVARLGTASVKDVREALGITSSAATQLVTELVKNNHAVRRVHEKDRRSTAVELTPETQRLFKSLQKQHLRKMTTVFRAFSDRELAEYAALHRKLARQASKI